MSKISIILPTYNVEKYIARALDSCINQTLKDIEIIVVDDKGQDKSIDIAKEYANRDSRIKIIDNIENKGTYEARNVGVRNASSELIMFLDPDDELELNACELGLEYIKDLDMICFEAVSLRDGIKIPFMNYKENIVLSQIEYLKIFYLTHWNIWAKLIKKELFLKAINLIHTQNRLVMAEDALMSYVIANLCNSVALRKEMIYKYYEDTSSITKSCDFDRYIKIKASYFDVINLIEKIQKTNNFDFNFADYCKNRLLLEYYSMTRRVYKKKNIFKYFKYKIISLKHKKIFDKSLMSLRGN